MEKKEFIKKVKEMNEPLKFNAKFHTYSYNKKRMISVTSLIKKYFSPFDADFWAAKKAPQLGMTSDQVKAMWKEKGARSIEKGNKVHKLAENYVNGLIFGSTDPFYGIVKSFFDNFPQLEIVGAEIKVCHPEIGVAGTLDLLMKDKENKYYIFDWKTNEKIDTDSEFQKGKEPISDLFDRNYTHYSLQLAFYAKILKEKYGIEIEDSMLIHTKEDGYTIYKCQKYEEELKAIIKNWSESNAK